MSESCSTSMPNTVNVKRGLRLHNKYLNPLSNYLHQLSCQSETLQITFALGFQGRSVSWQRWSRGDTWPCVSWQSNTTCSRSTEIHGHFSVSRQGKCPSISSIIHVLDAEIQGHSQKQRCLPCWLLREVFDHVRSKYLDPLNNYASTEQKTANYIDVDFQTPCVPWQRWYWDTNMAMCIIKTKQQHMCTIQRYMAISLYWDKGNGHLHHLWHMWSIQRYKDIFENRNLYQTLECPRRRSTKLQNITHVLGYILEPSREILKSPLPPLDVWVHQVCAGMPITSQNSWEPKSAKTGTCSLGYFNSCVALDSSNWVLVCSFSIWINASRREITPPSSSS